jgi:hypothetical protein
MQTVRKRRHHVTLDANYGLLLALRRVRRAALCIRRFCQSALLVWKKGPKSSECPLLQRHQPKNTGEDTGNHMPNKRNRVGFFTGKSVGGHILSPLGKVFSLQTGNLPAKLPDTTIFAVTATMVKASGKASTNELVQT